MLIINVRVTLLLIINRSLKVRNFFYNRVINYYIITSLTAITYFYNVL